MTVRKSGLRGWRLTVHVLHDKSLRYQHVKCVKQGVAPSLDEVLQTLDASKLVLTEKI